jgi:hypothetical protein
MRTHRSTIDSDRGARVGSATKALTRVFAVVLELKAAVVRFVVWCRASWVHTVLGCLGLFALVEAVLAGINTDLAAAGLVIGASIVVLLVMVAAWWGLMLLVVLGVPRVVRRVEYSIGVAFVRARRRTLELTLDDDTTAEPSSDELTPEIETHVYQNPYLPPGGTDVHAVVEVVAHGTDTSEGGGPEAVEIILLDCSGSMGQPWKKLRAARAATAAAIDALRDGVWFAVVRGSHVAERVYPTHTSLVRASDNTRRAARDALRGLWPEGGTAMGSWLTCARDLFATRPGAIAHAILLTDGKNESETETDFAAALDGCAGVFQCDCRGVGTEWDVDELRSISTRLMGTVDIVADPEDLADDFRTMAEAAMAKAVGRASLRVWTPEGSTLRFVKQVVPDVRDLTDVGTPADACSRDFPTGAWGEETRQYHVCVRVPARRVGDEMLAARVSLTVGDRIVSSALIKACWTDDEQESTRVDQRVGQAVAQAELADAVQLGLAARTRGDESGAAEGLGRAVALASENGNDAALQLLGRVVEIEDATTGTVRLRDRVDRADEMALDTRSTRTVPKSSLTDLDR